MKRRFKYILNYWAVQAALGSFFIGVLCVLLCKGSGDSGLVGIGFWCMVLAAVVNTIFLLMVTVHGVFRFTAYREHGIALGAVVPNMLLVWYYLPIELI